MITSQVYSRRMYSCFILPRLALACNEVEKKSVSQAEFVKKR
jgi:hypothetical protein